MKKYLWQTTALISLFITSLSLLPRKLLALSFDEGGEIADATELPTTSIDNATISFLKIMLGYLSLVAVIFVIYGGITWMTAAGNDEKVMKAKKILSGSVIGLVIILLAWVLVTFVFNTIAETAN